MRKINKENLIKVVYLSSKRQLVNKSRKWISKVENRHKLTYQGPYEKERYCCLTKSYDLINSLIEVLSRNKLSLNKSINSGRFRRKTRNQKHINLNANSLTSKRP